jgi:hypothetical protein
MRVDYSLPSLVPETLPELPGSVDGAPSFRDQLRTPASVMETNWQQKFHLDSRPANATYIGPPPRPAAMEVRDIESERTRWRNMLARHQKGLNAANPSNSGGHSVKVMLNMLLDMQSAEDEIVSQNAGLTRG